MQKTTETKANGNNGKVEKGHDQCRSRFLDELCKSTQVNQSGFGCLNLLRPHSVHNEHGCTYGLSSEAAAFLGIEQNVSQCAPLGLGEYLNVVHVQDRVKVADVLAGNKVETSNNKTIEFRLAPQKSLSKIGSPQWLEISSQVITDPMDQKSYSVITYRDISKQKASEAVMQDAADVADKASIAKSRFLANVSHELRTPLNAILGFSELLNSPLITSISPEKRCEYIGLIHTSAEHLLSVLNGILDMSKIETSNYEIFPDYFEMGSCLTKTIAMMRGQGHLRNISVNSTGFDDMPTVFADEKAIKQIVINLLSNAIKFSDDGSTVNVIAERRARTIRLRIVDTGIGISPEHQQKLGTPFFQADSKYDRKYEGTGLGLSVVKGLVELHHGELKFKSARGQGTTVEVILPIHGNGRIRGSGDKIEQLYQRASSQKHEAQPSDNHQLRIVRNTA